MSKSLTLSAAAALLAFTELCSAQAPPGGATAEMINTTLPLEGAPLAVKGPYEVSSEPTFGQTGFITFHPTKLDAFPKKDTLPILVWGNGGCAIDTGRYSDMLSTIASHGFLVLGTIPTPGAANRRATADDMKNAVDWADRENAREGSPLQGKIATDKVAAMGQSCGGFMSIRFGADARVKTIGVFNSGIQLPDAGAPKSPGGAPDAAALNAVHGPVLLINGSTRDFLMANSLAAYDAIDKLPTFYGARHNAGHTATAFHPGGGEWANVATNWVLWQFKGDKKAAAMFVGRDCDLCKNDNWDTKSKGLKR